MGVGYTSEQKFRNTQKSKNEKKKSKTTVKSTHLKFAKYTRNKGNINCKLIINQSKLTQIHTIESAAEISKVVVVCS